MANTERYIVAGRDMDGVYGYYVVDTHHPLFKEYRTDIMSSMFTHGLSMRKQEMVELAEKLNNEEA